MKVIATRITLKLLRNLVSQRHDKYQDLSRTTWPGSIFN